MSSSNATRIMFVPGAAGLGSFWEPLRAELPAGWAQSTLDLPGFGPVPPREDVQSYEQLVAHVARGIEAPSVVVGQSMGGDVTLELALRFPELVTRLVLVVAAGGVDMAKHGAHDWRPSPRPTGPGSWIYDPVPDLSARLHKITVPVLLLWATRDPISPLAVAHTLRAGLPRSHLVTIDSDDHWIARTFAREVAPTLRAFVEG